MMISFAIVSLHIFQNNTNYSVVDVDISDVIPEEVAKNLS